MNKENKTILELDLWQTDILLLGGINIAGLSKSNHNIFPKHEAKIFNRLIKYDLVYLSNTDDCDVFKILLTDYGKRVVDNTIDYIHREV